MVLGSLSLLGPRSKSDEAKPASVTFAHDETIHGTFDHALIPPLGGLIGRRRFVSGADGRAVMD